MTKTIHGKIHGKTIERTKTSVRPRARRSRFR